MMRGSFALIGTFHKRLDRTKPLFEAVLKSSILPDEFWVICEDEEDTNTAIKADLELNLQKLLPQITIEHLPTPRDKNSSYKVIPYSNKINWVLNRTTADYICYLDNNSMPDFWKYQIMVDDLDANPEYGAVYCSQRRLGLNNLLSVADRVIEDAYSVLNFTQVMHKKTKDRWPLDMKYALPADLADAEFWRKLHKSLGPFYPVSTEVVLDTHYISAVSAETL